MWAPKTLEAKKQDLDLSSSEQGSRTVTQILCDGHTLFNAVEFVKWSDEPLQIFLCEFCLSPRCGGGGCVIIRKLSDRVVIMPDMAAQSTGEWEHTEYAPPLIIRKQGSLLLNLSQWETVCAVCPEAPEIDALLPITAPELAMLYHYQTPRAFLPDPLHPENAKWDLILTSNGEDTTASIEHLKSFFVQPSNFISHDTAATLSEGYVISMFLDTSDLHEWPALSSTSKPWGYLSPDLHFKLFPKNSLA